MEQERVGNVRVYEAKDKPKRPVWLWLLPLLAIAAMVWWYLDNRADRQRTEAPATGMERSAPGPALPQSRAA